jgi:hypothetical protein
VKCVAIFKLLQLWHISEEQGIFSSLKHLLSVFCPKLSFMRAGKQKLATIRLLFSPGLSICSSAKTQNQLNKFLSNSALENFIKIFRHITILNEVR